MRELGEFATKNRYSPGVDRIAASIELIEDIEIGVGGSPLIIYVLYILFLSRISDFRISPSKFGANHI